MKYLLCFLMTMFFFLNEMAAQRPVGAIVGKVVNEMSGDVVLDAKVNVLLAGAHVKYGLTDHRGYYRIYDIEEGEYEILVKAMGFAPMMITQVPVRALENTALNLKFYNEGYASDTLVLSYYDLYPGEKGKGKKKSKKNPSKQKKSKAERRLEKAARELDEE